MHLKEAPVIVRNSPGNEDELSAEEKKKLKHKKKREARLDDQ